MQRDAVPGRDGAQEIDLASPATVSLPGKAQARARSALAGASRVVFWFSS